MISGSVVFYKIATTCLLIFVGYIVRRIQLLPEISVSVLSKYVIYLALPSYFIFYMPSAISMETLGRYWFFPLVGAAVMAVNDLFAYVSARLWARPGELGTFRLLVGIPNWVFMALAVCEPLFPEDGVRVILLYNVGVMFYVWTGGMTSFRSGSGLKETLKKLFVSVQTAALVIGVALALAFPTLREMGGWDSATLAALPFHIGIATPFWETVSLLGSTALPVSILQIGVLLGSPHVASEGGESVSDLKPLLLTSFLRLLAGPLVVILFLLALRRLGVPLTANEFVITVIMMAMPAAVLCVSIAEVYGGSPRLAAKGILWGTAASLFTAPLATYMAQLAYS